MTVHHLPEFLVLLHITETTDFVPALVGQPGGGGVSQLILQAHASRQEEHELVLIQLILRSIQNGEKQVKIMSSSQSQQSLQIISFTLQIFYSNK